MEKIVFEKSDIRDFVKNTIAEKIEKLKNFIEFTLEASRDIKKHQSMTACGKKCRKKYTRCRDSLVL